jgi:flavin reductase (DIM6/NTAB) family NADH-FMN oxidoreductase RutF
MSDDLEIDAADVPARDSYFLLTALVVPRAIAWVSTLSGSGVPNVAPHSYFTIAANDPPHVLFTSTGLRDTVTNIRQTGEFVVNIVSADLVEPMNLTSAEFPPDVDEFERAGVTAAPSVSVAAPRVAEARAHLECRAVSELAVGDSFVTVGRVEHIHVSSAVLRDGRVDPMLLAPVARLSGSGYSELGRVFRLPRPTWPTIGTR